MSSIHVGVVMDPIAEISPAKDSTLAMLLAAQKRGHELHYFEQIDLRLLNGEALGNARKLRVSDDQDCWFELSPVTSINLAELDVVLMRKDPPFDTEYIYTTYILEQAEESGVLIVNRPASLRDINEKAFTSWFPHCCPDTLITRSIRELKTFLKDQAKIVEKPLDGKGGRSGFIVEKSEANVSVILETITEDEPRYTMAQRYVPEIRDGDKRIILVNGDPADFALARIPQGDDSRGNLVMGAKAQTRELTDRDRWICQQVGPVLKEKGVLFAGLDVIGDYLTEINVTSPTGIRELQRLAGCDPAESLFDSIEKTLRERQAAA